VKETEDTVEFRRSRLKFAALSVAPLYFGAVGLRQLVLGEPLTVFLGGLVAVGLGSAASLLWLAYDRTPALVIDGRGIAVNWPKIGLIPWSAVAGLAVGRAPFVRSVLMIALDPDEAGPELMAKAQPHLASSLLPNPAANRFRAQVRNAPILQVKIAFLDASRAEVQRVLEERVRVRGA
jgi:hypothetical protein